jgi:hypothetical protein
VLAGTGEVTLSDHLIGLGVAILIHAGILVRIVTRKRQLEMSGNAARSTA